MVQNYHANKLLTFMHIPKAAGTTLRKIIEKQYKQGELITFNHPTEVIPKINSMSQQDLDNVKCLSGHGYFGTFHDYFSKRFIYITLMRDPVERVISEYYFLLNSPAHPDYEKIKNVSFEEFIRLNEFKGRSKNAQTRYFSGINQSPNLEIAKKNINEYFLIVGTLERFNESLFLMKKELCWKDLAYKKRNETKNRPLIEQLTQETVNHIKENNQMDIELNADVNEQLQKKIDFLSTDLKQRLTKFIKKDK